MYTAPVFQILFDNKAHSGKVKLSLLNEASIKECRDTNVSGHGETTGNAHLCVSVICWSWPCLCLCVQRIVTHAWRSMCWWRWSAVCLWCCVDAPSSEESSCRGYVWPCELHQSSQKNTRMGNMLNVAWINQMHVSALKSDGDNTVKHECSTFCMSLCEWRAWFCSRNAHGVCSLLYHYINTWSSSPELLWNALQEYFSISFQKNCLRSFHGNSSK